MTKAATTESTKGNRGNQLDSHTPERMRLTSAQRPDSRLMTLQRSLGNGAVGQLLKSSMNGSAKVASTNDYTAATTPGSRGERASSAASLLKNAQAEVGQPLDASVRAPMEQALGRPLSEVRVRSGPASEAAAARLGARAYTLGSEIYLGAEGNRSTGHARNKLLAHEAVHTVQQGGGRVDLQGSLRVSNPADHAEAEAQSFAEQIISTGGQTGYSPAIALRNQLRPTQVAPEVVSRIAAPLIQRDLKRPYKLPEGTFNLDLTTFSNPGGNSGMGGTIKFKADDTAAPDSKNIRLLQVAKVVNLKTGKDHIYTGGEVNRNKVMTPSGIPGVQEGFFVDVVHANRSPRAAKGDAEVSPYYIDDYKSLGRPYNKDGSKQGKTVTEASLGDAPNWNTDSQFSFETVAKAKDTGHIYGTVMWGFTISDAAKGTVEKERAVGRHVTLKSTDIAIEKFNEFYRNPGASTAP